MPKITSIEPQKSSKGRSASGRRNPKRFNVFLDGQFAFGADEDLVVNNRLTIGKIIEKEELKKLLFKAEVGKLLEKIYRLFSFRQRSEKEVRDYFRIKNQEAKIKGKEVVSDLAIEQIIEILKQKRIINDLEFARAWVEARRKSRQKGLIALKTELIQKGIDRSIIEEVLGEKNSETEKQLARTALNKKMRIWAGLPKDKLKEKAAAFLLRRGFNWDITRDVIDDILKKE